MISPAPLYSENLSDIPPVVCSTFLTSPHIVCSTSMGNKRVETESGGKKNLKIVLVLFSRNSWAECGKESVCTDEVCGFYDHTSPSNTLGTRRAIVGADNNGLRLKHQAICLVEYTLLALSEVLLGQMYAVFT